MEIAYTPHAPSELALEFIQATIPEDLRAEILNRIKVKKDKFNHRLVGHIKEEWDADLEHWDLWHEMIHELVNAYNEHFPVYRHELGELVGDINLAVDTPWVNYMHKHEYNPIHQHSGIFSYVTWISVPYTLEDESKVFADAKKCNNGNFVFVCPSNDGTLEYTLPIDKSYEWEIVLFRSRQQHCVYPFYTTDEPRISVAGNVVIDKSVDKLMPS